MRRSRGGSLFVSFVFACLLGGLVVEHSEQPADASAATTAFGSGSLILPTTSPYQDDCGAVSVYGLIYDILRANHWLGSNGKTPITINYIINDTKLSPNRCEPTNLNTNPASGTAADWIDGCDMTMTGAAPLIKLVNNTATSSGNDSTTSTISTTASTTVFPTYASVSLATATTVRYGGGPFVIAPADVPNFLALLDGTFAATDTNGNAIDFSPFRTNKGACSLGGTHYVNIHRAQTSFSAVVAKQFNAQPPRLALLEDDTGNNTGSIRSSSGFPQSLQSAQESGTTATFVTKQQNPYSVGNQILVTGVNVGGYNGLWTVTQVVNNTTFKVTLPTSGLPQAQNNSGTSEFGGEILPKYLIMAGLGFSGAQGCPTNGYNVADTNICPIGGTAGQIYDALDFEDLVTNKLTIQDLGVQRYHMIWTPHWETSGDSSNPPTAAEQTALLNMSTFLNGPNGLLAECASIESYEGAWVGTNGTAGTGFNSGIQAAPAKGMQLQTCVGSNNICTSGTAIRGTIRNVSNEPQIDTFLVNCSDPSTASNSSCTQFDHPADTFVQTGDYRWLDVIGTVEGYQTATGSTFRPGVQTLIAAKNKKSDAAPVEYYVTRNVKDNTPGESNVAYLAGHDQTFAIAGVKIALLTLLQLGLDSTTPPTTTTETSRSSGILALINAQNALATASFNDVQPAPASTQVADVALPVCGDLQHPGACIGSAGDVGASWLFPYVTGKVHAVTVGSVTGTASSIGGSGTDLVHGGIIPTVDFTQCATSGFTTSLRHVFTTTNTVAGGSGLGSGTAFVSATSPLTSLAFCNANAATLNTGGRITSVAGVNNTTLVQHIVQGATNGSGGYIAAMGGVNRSTLAVIQQSTAVPVTRPSMIYVGALDGMLHAFCADNLTGVCANNIGAELWAFLPRMQLGGIATNGARIDGSPHVIDAFGNFGTGTKTFHTVMTFQTASGNPMSATAAQPAVYAINVDDPANPKVLWEYTVPVPGTPRAFELGAGLTSASGPINLAGQTRWVTVVETNNGNTATPGIFVNALDLETGTPIWPAPFQIATPQRNGAVTIPTTGIVGGAVAYDRNSSGFLTDVVFGDLKGDLWDLDISTGLSRYVDAFNQPKPLFQFQFDYHSIGAPPAIYSNGSKLYAAFVSGGFADPGDNAANLWESSGNQFLVSVALAPTVGTPLTELTTTGTNGFALQLTGATEKGFAQVHIQGDQLLVTSDTSDVNNSTYGTTAATGHAYAVSMSAPSLTVINNVGTGGASSIATSSAIGGTSMYLASGNKQQAIGTDDGTTGQTVNTTAVAKVTRNLWLRTE